MIWLLRHGDAAEGSPDSERPLTDKGREQSRAVGAALKALGVEIDACLTSPKVRAAETARIACEQLGDLEP
jgi:phosphohistidine phosphatase